MVISLWELCLCEICWHLNFTFDKGKMIYFLFSWIKNLPNIHIVATQWKCSSLASSNLEVILNKTVIMPVVFFSNFSFFLWIFIRWRKNISFKNVLGITFKVWKSLKHFPPRLPQPSPTKHAAWWKTEAHFSNCSQKLRKNRHVQMIYYFWYPE